MNQMEYSKQPVFIPISHYVEESIEHLYEGHFDTISAMMEEVVNFREDVKQAEEKANINPQRFRHCLI